MRLLTRPAPGPAALPAATPPPAVPPTGVPHWLPSAPCTPGHCLAGTFATVGRPRQAARCAAGIALVAVGLALAPLVRCCRPALRGRLTRAWARTVPAAFGVRVRIRVSGAAGGVPAGGVLVVANHISWLDIPLVAAVRPARMLAKSEVASWPFLGALVSRGGTLFIERDRLRALPGTVARIASVLRAGTPVVVFPEGSTWCGRRQGRFRPAVFQAALDARVAVQPVLIRYRLGAGPATAAAFVGEDTLVASLLRVTAARGLVAEVSVLPPIPPGAHHDRRSLARAAQRAVTGPEFGPPDRHGPPPGPGRRLEAGSSAA
ncbi:1-acyl-sn-glycerol-3-phosphate acyltransferase [Streptomyces sp. SID13666]|uniref:lysophospholipid acyltransferase family protein n=1 Tax=Streptomyces TaxID=1883 RepID=UPI0011071FB5|nr:MULTISPECIES: lysophospholipid acyltransferase family protein [Streptomyces]MCZ4103753.1 lysophospholipid acyltransferase family protein [Streptomyces sp. H39-C1]NEA57369.1 1-acyl-sn-glycerol-3-phosphate acyltransferase [Streptomyces sp. SID13666]NEA73423.1 1-acyl-sn-glycerol-3-phosphate acyltransferase [Streptomyces sp. SID13588]QNA75898.1 1-acyl-sn-glycerol-3-phosphate acyltransferase [Streptomyces sp. So13.3]